MTPHLIEDTEGELEAHFAVGSSGFQEISTTSKTVAERWTKINTFKLLSLRID